MGSIRSASSAKWKWKCSCEWGYLVHEAACHPTSEARVWCDEMKTKYGDDIDNWPTIGCGAGFRAYSNGPSMVLELRKDVGDRTGNSNASSTQTRDEDEWEAYLSERIPSPLDAAMKRANYEKLREAFKKVTLNEDEIYSLLPMALPKTHRYKMPDGTTLRGVARYPIEQWRKEGRPYMTKLMWVALFKAVALKDMENLHTIFDVCDKAQKCGLVGN